MTARPAAPELSGEERQRVEQFEAAPAAEESLRERVAFAMREAHFTGPAVTMAEMWDRLADAALAVVTAAHEGGGR